MGGSGRQSLTKLATFIANYELFQIEVNKTYSMENWKNDLKKVLKRAGADGKKIVFLFTDLQIKDESFLEDVSMILTTGEVPNLFAADEKAEILDRSVLTNQRPVFYLLTNQGSAHRQGGGQGAGRDELCQPVQHLHDQRQEQPPHCACHEPRGYQVSNSASNYLTNQRPVL